MPAPHGEAAMGTRRELIEKKASDKRARPVTTGFQGVQLRIVRAVAGPETALIPVGRPRITASALVFRGATDGNLCC